jgi:NifU-like protein involved in Fe-S cluster formation
MEEHTIEAEIASHAMNPKHYGELRDADGVGVGVDPSGVYMIFYIKVDGDTLTDAAYATSGSQNAVTLGSMLSEMVIGDTLVNIGRTVGGLEAEVEALYREKEERIEALKAAGSRAKVSMTEQDNAAMVLASFRAALKHRERRLEGIGGEQYRITIEQRGGDRVKRGCGH